MLYSSTENKCLKKAANNKKTADRAACHFDDKRDCEPRIILYNLPTSAWPIYHSTATHSRASARYYYVDSRARKVVRPRNIPAT